MLRKAQTNRSIDILSRLLAEENLEISHDPKATTARFYPKLRKLVLPTYGNQISTVSQIGFSLHETGHATDSPNEEECGRLFKEYGKAVFNILEDVRIEKIVKSKYPGSSKYFVKMYDELVIEHDFFGTADQNNPFDFSSFNFLNRVNCHFKVGAKAMVPFNSAEQVLVDEIAAIETIADLEIIATKLKEIAKENAEKKAEENAPSPFSPDSDDEGEESNDDESGDSESSDDFEPETEDEDINADPDFDDSESDSDENSDEGEESNDEYSEDGASDFDSDSDDGENEESDDDSDGSDSGSLDDDSESDEDFEEDGAFGSSDSDEDGEDSDSDDDSVEIDEDDLAEGDSESGEESEDGEESESGSDSDDGEEGDEGDSPDANDDGDPSDGEESSDDVESDPNRSGENDEVELEEDDLEESSVLDHSASAMEELAKNAGKVGRLPRTKDIKDKVQPWQDIEQFIDDQIASGGRYNYSNVSYYDPSHLKTFRNEIKPLVNKMVSEFNRNAAGSVSRRTAYKDTGVLDPMKMVHYKYNENIFKKRKFVRAGKNHGVVLFVDLTGSMQYRITDIMRQVLLMTEFCKKINLPFRVYGWSNTYLPSTSGEWADQPYSFSNAGNFDIVGLTELLTNDMPKAKYEKYARFFLRNNYEVLVGGSTPLISAMYYAMPAIEKFRKESGAEIVKMMMFTDGSGHTTLDDWGSDSWIDEQTGTQYSQKELMDDFQASDFSIYDWPNQKDAQQYFIAKVLKDRYDVSTVFIYMNKTRQINTKASSSGQWTKPESKAIRKTLKEGAPVVEFGERGNCYTYIAIKDGYQIATHDFKMTIPEGSTDRQIKKIFLESNKLRKSSTLFATLTAKAIAQQ